MDVIGRLYLADGEKYKIIRRIGEIPLKKVLACSMYTTESDQRLFCRVRGTLRKNSILRVLVLFSIN